MSLIDEKIPVVGIHTYDKNAHYTLETSEGFSFELHEVDDEYSDGTHNVYLCITPESLAANACFERLVGTIKLRVNKPHHERGLILERNRTRPYKRDELHPFIYVVVSDKPSAHQVLKQGASVQVGYCVKTICGLSAVREHALLLGTVTRFARI